MVHGYGADAKLFATLTEIDEVIAEKVRGAGCSDCGGPLERADYERKPGAVNLARSGGGVPASTELLLSSRWLPSPCDAAVGEVSGAQGLRRGARGGRERARSAAGARWTRRAATRARCAGTNGPPMAGLLEHHVRAHDLLGRSQGVLGKSRGRGHVAGLAPLALRRDDGGGDAHAHAEVDRADHDGVGPGGDRDARVSPRRRWRLC
jgi:hypothetical protein